MSKVKVTNWIRLVLMLEDTDANKNKAVILHHTLSQGACACDGDAILKMEQVHVARSEYIRRKTKRGAK